MCKSVLGRPGVGLMCLASLLLLAQPAAVRADPVTVTGSIALNVLEGPFGKSAAIGSGLAALFTRRPRKGKPAVDHSWKALVRGPLPSDSVREHVGYRSTRPNPWPNGLADSAASALGAR